MPRIDTPHFRIEPCLDCPAPGYLIVSAHETAASLDKLSTGAQQALGVVLGVCVGEIAGQLHPARVYTAQFSERSRGVHFHVFPRTAELAAAFRQAFPEEAEIDGPRLLSWVRGNYHDDNPRASSAFNHKLLARIQTVLNAQLGGENPSSITGTPVLPPAHS